MIYKIINIHPCDTHFIYALNVLNMCIPTLVLILYSSDFLLFSRNSFSIIWLLHIKSKLGCYMKRGFPNLNWKLNQLFRNLCFLPQRLLDFSISVKQLDTLNTEIHEIFFNGSLSPLMCITIYIYLYVFQTKYIYFI